MGLKRFKQMLAGLLCAGMVLTQPCIMGVNVMAETPVEEIIQEEAIIDEVIAEEITEETITEAPVDVVETEEIAIEESPSEEVVIEESSIEEVASYEPSTVTSQEFDVSDYVVHTGGLKTIQSETVVALDASSAEDAAYIEEVGGYTPASLSPTMRRKVKGFIVSYLEEHESVINIKGFNVPSDEFPTIYSEILNENPGLYFVNGGYRINVDNQTKCVIDITPSYNSFYTVDKTTAVSDAVKVIADNANKYSTSDFEKVLYVHDYLAQNVEYDIDNVGRDYSLVHYIYNPYGALVNKKAVCQGYAEAFAYIMKALNIESCLVTSDNMNHAWNAVKLDGSWYHLDVTWDDPLVDAQGRAMHKYFLLSDVELKNEDESIRDKHFDYEFKNSSVSCSSTTYDDAWWVNIDSLITPYGSDYYYVKIDKVGPDYDHENAKVTLVARNKTSDSEVAKDEKPAVWITNETESSIQFTNGVASLSRINDTLFYNSHDHIYSYNLANNQKKECYTLPTSDTSSRNWIFGSMVLDDYANVGLSVGKNAGSINTRTATLGYKASVAAPSEAPKLFCQSPRLGSGDGEINLFLSYTEGYEYQCNNGPWQDSSLFSNLKGNTEYKFKQRVKATDEALASPASAELRVTTVPESGEYGDEDRVKDGIYINSTTTMLKKDQTYDVYALPFIAGDEVTDIIWETPDSDKIDITPYSGNRNFSAKITAKSKGIACIKATIKYLEDDVDLLSREMTQYVYIDDSDVLSPTKSTDGKFYYIKDSSDEEITILSYAGSYDADEITIPNEIDGFKVKKIMPDLFAKKYVKTLKIETSNIDLSDFAFNFDLNNIYFTGSNITLADNWCEDLDSLDVIKLPDDITILSKKLLHKYGSKTQNVDVLGIPASATSIDSDFLPENTEYSSLVVLVQDMDANFEVVKYARSKGYPVLKGDPLTSEIDFISIGDGFRITRVDDQLAITNYDESLDKTKDCTLSIPLKVGEYDVKDINKNIFKNNYAAPNIKELTVQAPVNGVWDIDCQSLRGLEKVTFPNSITEIGDGVFKDCKYLKEALFVLDGAQIKTIGDSAFEGCDSLYAIKIPASVTSIGTDAFKNSGLKKIHGEAGSTAQTYAESKGYDFDTLQNYDPNDPDVKSYTYNGVVYKYTVNDGKATITGVECNTASYLDIVLTFPSYVDNVNKYPITNIKKGFMGADARRVYKLDLTKTSLTEIPDELFGLSDDCLVPYPRGYYDDYEWSDVNFTAYDFYRMVAVSLPSTVTKIGDRAFAGCTSLELINLENVTTLGVSSFESTHLKNVKLNDNITSIPARCFRYCVYWLSYNETRDPLSLPNKLETLGEAAFADSNFFILALPEKITVIPKQAFASVQLGKYFSLDNVTEMGEAAFRGVDPYVDTLSIPTGISVIPDECFMYSRFNKVYIPKNITKIGKNAFYSYRISEVEFDNEIDSITIGEGAFSKVAEVDYKDENGEWQCKEVNVLFKGSDTLTATLKSQGFTCAEKYVATPESPGSSTVKAELDSSDIAAISEENPLSVEAPKVNLDFNGTASDIISDIAEDDGVSVDITEVSSTNVDEKITAPTAKEEVKKVIQNGGVVFDFSLTFKDSDDKVEFETLGNKTGGSVKVTIDFTADGSKLAVADVQAYYIDDNGVRHDLDTVYDEVNNKVSFETNHFSLYAVDYKDKCSHSSKSLAKNASSHWYECNSCHKMIGTAEAHKWSAEYTEIEPPTTEKPGKEVKTCTVCGQQGQQRSIPKLHEHKGSGSWQADETSHWKVCSCEEKAIVEMASHECDTWTKDPTRKNTETGRCTICGQTAVRRVMPTYPGTKDIATTKITLGTGKFANDYELGDGAKPKVTITKSKNSSKKLKGMMVANATEAENLIIDEDSSISDIHYLYYLTNNTVAGQKGKITIVGVPMNGYHGKITKEFKIAATSIKSFKIKGVKGSYKYTGSPIEPGGSEGGADDAPDGFYIYKKVNGKTVKFTKGVNFTVSYKKNVNKGTATIIIKGINNCSGTIKKTFKIKK